MRASSNWPARSSRAAENAFSSLLTCRCRSDAARFRAASSRSSPSKRLRRPIRIRTEVGVLAAMPPVDQRASGASSATAALGRLDQWERLKTVAVKLPERRGCLAAAQLLREHAFVLHHGTNGFGDNFELLNMRAPMARYVDLASRRH